MYIQKPNPWECGFGFLSFADFSSVVLEMAVNMKWKDFEDAIQSATAEYVHADYIITRNIKDFTQSKVMEWLLLMKIAL